VGGPADFDFWLGTWEVTWGDEGARGRNVITKSFDGRVVEERFDGRPGVELQGMSVNVYDAPRDRWLQTWVDDQGNYFALEGAMRDGEMVLHCDRHSGEDQSVVYRMRFHDIEPDSFTWSWERSADGGASYDLAWRLAYRREGGI
jgi:hypothetical protein